MNNPEDIFGFIPDNEETDPFTSAVEEGMEDDEETGEPEELDFNKDA